MTMCDICDGHCATACVGWSSTVIQSARLKLEHLFLIIDCAEIFGASFKACTWGLCGFELVTVQTLCAVVVAIRIY